MLGNWAYLFFLEHEWGRICATNSTQYTITNWFPIELHEESRSQAVKHHHISLCGVDECYDCSVKLWRPWSCWLRVVEKVSKLAFCLACLMLCQFKVGSCAWFKINALLPFTGLTFKYKCVSGNPERRNEMIFSLGAITLSYTPNELICSLSNFTVIQHHTLV